MKFLKKKDKDIALIDTSQYEFEINSDEEKLKLLKANVLSLESYVTLGMITRQCYEDELMMIDNELSEMELKYGIE